MGFCHWIFKRVYHSNQTYLDARFMIRFTTFVYSLSFGNQTLLAGKSTISFDDFPSYEPPLSSGMCPLPHLVAEQYIQMGFKHLQTGDRDTVGYNQSLSWLVV